jgi:hypothetical protein
MTTPRSRKRKKPDLFLSGYVDLPEPIVPTTQKNTEDKWQTVEKFARSLEKINTIAKDTEQTHNNTRLEESVHFTPEFKKVNQPPRKKPRLEVDLFLSDYVDLPESIVPTTQKNTEDKWQKAAELLQKSEQLEIEKELKKWQKVEELARSLGKINTIAKDTEQTHNNTRLEESVHFTPEFKTVNQPPREKSQLEVDLFLSGYVDLPEPTVPMATVPGITMWARVAEFALKNSSVQTNPILSQEDQLTSEYDFSEISLPDDNDNFLTPFSFVNQ